MAAFGLFRPDLEPLLHEFLRRADPSSGSVAAGGGDWRAHASAEDLVLESWSQGFLVGSLIIMAAITIANMRRKVLLHKFILLEQLMAMCHGTFCFMDWKGYGWYLSGTATLLYLSWIVHNIVAWMKIKPFFIDQGSMFKRETGIWVRNIYLSTLALTVPVNIFQIFNNFRFFNNINNLYTSVRPYEPLIRDPWWVFTCLTLFHVIRKCYGTGFIELIRKSPRFGILLAAIFLSISFTALDIVASIHNFIGSTDGINPFWKLSLVFKCLTDTIMLDDFKTELKRLGVIRIQKQEKRRNSVALVLDDKDGDFGRELEFADALNTNPARYHDLNNFNRNNALNQGDDPQSRLRHASMDNSRSSEVRVEPRNRNGKGGTKIGRLPGLTNFSFESIKPGKKAKADSHVDDEEKGSPTEEQIRCNGNHNGGGTSDENSPDERVANMPSSFDAFDFQTRPEGY